MSQLSVDMEVCDGMNAEERWIKRGADMLGALLGMIVLSPLFVLIYVLLKLEGKGPAIFRQEQPFSDGNPLKSSSTPCFS